MIFFLSINIIRGIFQWLINYFNDNFFANAADIQEYPWPSYTEYVNLILSFN